MINREALQKWMKTESAYDKKKAFHGLSHKEAIIVSKFMDNISGKSYGDVEDYKTELRKNMMNGSGGNLLQKDMIDLIRLASESQMSMRGEDPTIDPHAIPAGTSFERMPEEIKSLRAAGQTEAADALEKRFTQFTLNRTGIKIDKKGELKKWESDREISITSELGGVHVNEHNRESIKTQAGNRFDSTFPKPVVPDAKKD